MQGDKRTMLVRVRLSGPLGVRMRGLLRLAGRSETCIRDVLEGFSSAPQDHGACWEAFRRAAAALPPAELSAVVDLVRLMGRALFLRHLLGEALAAEAPQCAPRLASAVAAAESHSDRCETPSLRGREHVLRSFLGPSDASPMRSFLSAGLEGIDPLARRQTDRGVNT
jgi:hypothetical protein